MAKRASRWDQTTPPSASPSGAGSKKKKGIGPERPPVHRENFSKEAAAPILETLEPSVLCLPSASEDLPKRPVRKLQEKVVGGSRSAVFVVRLTADGKYCMTAGQDRTVRLWNPHRTDPAYEGVAEAKGSAAANSTPLPGGLLVKSYAGPHGHEIRDVAISRDNAAFASVGGDRAAFYWDVASSRVIRRLQGHDSRINCCCLNADATVLLTGSYDKKILAWDLRSNNAKPIQTIEGCRDSVTSIALSPSGTEIVCGSVDGCVRVFDLTAARCHEDQLHQSVTCARVSYDGNCLLASCMGRPGRSEGIVSLLEKDTGVELGVYRGHTHESYGMECCFSNSDAHVLSGSEDGTIFIWDMVEGFITRKLLYHTKATCSLAFHPKQAMLISGSHDGSAIVWQ